MTTLREAAQALVDRLDAVHSDGRYQSVWTISQLHVGPYSGPAYVDELAALRAALASSTPGPESTPSSAVPPEGPSKPVQDSVTEGVSTPQPARGAYEAGLSAPAPVPSRGTPDAHPGEGGPCLGCGSAWSAKAEDVAWASAFHDLGVATCPRCQYPAIVKLDPSAVSSETRTAPDLDASYDLTCGECSKSIACDAFDHGRLRPCLDFAASPRPQGDPDHERKP